jgi:hypothetical protein
MQGRCLLECMNPNAKYVFVGFKKKYLGLEKIAKKTLRR